MKIIFLDIDGVLNDFSKKSFKQPHLFKGLINQIEPDKIKLLNKLVKETEAKIVISSNWRKNKDSGWGFTTSELQEMLEKQGFIGEVVDNTPFLYYKLSTPKSRADEIWSWLDINTKPKGIVILDDTNINIGHNDHDMSKWFIKVDPMKGLTKEDVIKAKIMLEVEYTHE